MDMETIATTVTGLLVAAQTGAIEAATDVVKKIGKSGVEKLCNVVKGYFNKDGEGAVKKLEELERNPASPQAQDAVKGRLLMYLKEDPAFLAEITALIGEVRIDQSITQTATSGDKSPIIQIVGKYNSIR
ncbi:hypothetical protein [Desulfolutivibrio sulfoxidireducens]|uniref:hypothetical protein n=1 Tax=Desulfolutivibrio sulfoxidireducens TaxID=2773299 RepID=UPI00159D10C6|nr:hypothetical protein [Desulfolutivibrio sulfoxidireducens]QLA19587.1 hypothetical protein GD604_07465 [Desulfolutivibrio sulfoxidireducens]